MRSIIIMITFVLFTTNVSGQTTETYSLQSITEGGKKVIFWDNDQADVKVFKLTRVRSGVKEARILAFDQEYKLMYVDGARTAITLNDKQVVSFVSKNILIEDSKYTMKEDAKNTWAFFSQDGQRILTYAIKKEQGKKKLIIQTYMENSRHAEYLKVVALANQSVTRRSSVWPYVGLSIVAAAVRSAM
jgi:hypothetical protein